MGNIPGTRAEGRLRSGQQKLREFPNMAEENEVIQEGGRGIVQFLLGVVRAVITAVRSIVSGVTDTIKDVISSLVDWLVSAISSIAQQVIGRLATDI